MSTLLQTILIILCLSLSSCQPESTSAAKKNNLEVEDVSILHLLFFKKEQKLEFWVTKNDSKIKFLKSYTAVSCENTPIGIYQLEFEDQGNLLLEPPNDYYDEKMGINELNEIYILSIKDKNQNRESIVIKEKDLRELKKVLPKNTKTQAYVFPNDLRMDGVFEACFGCPHRIAELYSSLELHLRNFGSES